jgi:hypothetical protein
MGNVMATTAPLLAAYATCPTCPSNAAILAVLTMHPLIPSESGSRFAIRSAESRAKLNVPTALIWRALENNVNGSRPGVDDIFFESVLKPGATPAQEMAAFTTHTQPFN